jgi:hypothetical protein
MDIAVDHLLLDALNPHNDEPVVIPPKENILTLARGADPFLIAFENESFFFTLEKLDYCVGFSSVNIGEFNHLFHWLYDLICFKINFRTSFT